MQSSVTSKGNAFSKTSIIAGEGGRGASQAGYYIHDARHGRRRGGGRRMRNTLGGHWWSKCANPKRLPEVVTQCACGQWEWARQQQGRSWNPEHWKNNSFLESFWSSTRAALSFPGTGTAGTAFQEPKPEPEPSLSLLSLGSENGEGWGHKRGDLKTPRKHPDF